LSQKLTAPENACLVIADISGYTSYLAGAELNHAQDILADLIDTIVRSLRPTFRLAELEGDAAFAYVVTERIDGSLLQDAIEATYFAFRRRLRDIKQASRCECNACVLIPSLDLKFVVHHGAVIRQRLAGREQLVGRDVIVVHRLLKNSIQATLGVGAYAAYTAECIAAMGVTDPAAQGLREHREPTDLGEVTVWVRDLEAAWRSMTEGTRVEVTAEDAYRVFRVRVPPPPQLTWEYVTSPIRRPQWGPGIDLIDERAPTGRRGAGTTNHCMHGKDAIVEEILDWRPFEYQTTRSAMPMPGTPKLTMTEVLAPTEDGGTEVELRVAKPRPRDRAAFERLMPLVGPMLEESQEGLRTVLEAEAERQRAAADVAEPALQRSEQRFVREPVAVENLMTQHRDRRG
jgi:uncharacterized protein YndB with AHSA1/START domain